MYLKLSQYIDAAILKPDITKSEFLSAIDKCLEYNVKTVCVKPCDIELAIKICNGTNTEVSTVLNFPHGSSTFRVKEFEAMHYVELGVHEIDMVVNYSYIKSGLWDLVKQDIQAVSSISTLYNILLKVIIETSVLSIDEIAKATEIVSVSNAQFIKTSTGFNGAGADFESAELMIKTANGRIKVKASGGIKDYETAKKYIDIGCERLGIGYSSLDNILNNKNILISEKY